jgi:RNA polymerase sigma-70 factor (ECF subfamily)
VWRSARRLGVPSAAVDDVVQEIFLVIARRHDDFEARSSLRTWIFGIVVGIVRNYRRSARRKDAPLVASDEAPETRSDDRPSQPGPYRLAVKAEALRLLHRLLDELDDDKREVFVMAELEQLAMAEIAEAIGIKVNTVQSRLRAARQKFDEALARHRARDGWRYR